MRGHTMNERGQIQMGIRKFPRGNKKFVCTFSFARSILHSKNIKLNPKRMTSRAARSLLFRRFEQRLGKLTHTYANTNVRRVKASNKQIPGRISENSISARAVVSTARKAAVAVFLRDFQAKRQTKKEDFQWLKLAKDEGYEVGVVARGCGEWRRHVEG